MIVKGNRTNKQNNKQTKKGKTMKLNVKGLVFVGFAAAILSANAMAATGDEKIVTSKAFTEATYQAKTAANKAGQVLKMGSATAGDIDYIAVDTTVTASSDNLVTSGAVATAIANQGLGSTYEVLSNKLDDGEGKTIATNGNSTTLYPSAKAVKTYADSKVSSASTVGTSTTVAPNEKAVSDALETKQPNLTGSATQVTLGNATYKNIASTSAGITTGEDTIPTSGAVADAISGAIAGEDLSQYQVASDRAAEIVDDGTANDNSASTTKYASNAAVTGWAQKKLSGTNGQLVTYGATAGAVGSATLGTSALTIRQNNVANATTFGANATSDVTIDLATPDWNAASDAAGYIANKPSVEVTGNKIQTITSTSTSTEYPSAAAVYNYVNGLSGSSIPNGSNCSAEAPCALVATGTNTFAWVPMSQPSNN